MIRIRNTENHDTAGGDRHEADVRPADGGQQAGANILQNLFEE